MLDSKIAAASEIQAHRRDAQVVLYQILCQAVNIKFEVLGDFFKLSRLCGPEVQKPQDIA